MPSPSSDSDREQILKLAPFFQGMVGAALDRANLGVPKALYFRPADMDCDQELACDFRQHKNLMDADRLMMPVVRGIVAEAARREMTAMLQLYARPHMQYALEFGVAAKSFLEITAELAGRRLAPAPVERNGGVLAFPRR